MDHPVLAGRFIRLEPLSIAHAEALQAASDAGRAADPDLYRWNIVPHGHDEVIHYIETALALRDADKAVPFATVRIADNAVIGSTRFFDIETWPWPAGHPRHGRPHPDVCEIGYTWLTHSAIRTAANTEAKLMMLTHAFEVWKMERVCLHTDARNQRSRAAIERIGAKFEGILRAHRIGTDLTIRDSARFSIVAADWPATKRALAARLRTR
jgi:RimJ/RimL family protein N-acetyltransferase